MNSLPLKAIGYVLLAGVFSASASAQFQVATPGRDLSYTISTAQLWTDTGIDLQSGDVLQFHATSTANASENCEPAGISGASTAGLRWFPLPPEP
jgi:hypothetical protein